MLTGTATSQKQMDFSCNKVVYVLISQWQIKIFFFLFNVYASEMLLESFSALKGGKSLSNFNLLAIVFFQFIKHPV